MVASLLYDLSDLQQAKKVQLVSDCGANEEAIILLDPLHLPTDAIERASLTLTIKGLTPSPKNKYVSCHNLSNPFISALHAGCICCGH
jgi:hypothetical protein